MLDHDNDNVNQFAILGVLDCRYFILGMQIKKFQKLVRASTAMTKHPCELSFQGKCWDRYW